MFRYFFITVFLFIISGCSSTNPSGNDPFPFDDYDYSIHSLELGVAFPPNSTQEHREFSIIHMDKLDMNLLRIQQDWALREPENGQFNWLPLENRLQDFFSAGIDVMITLGLDGFPSWFYTLESSQQEEEFRQFINELLQLYGSTIAYIQLGNEWNWELDEYFYVNDELYIRLSNILFDELESMTIENPPRVLLGSLSIGGLRTIAYASGELDNVTFSKGDLYSQKEISQADALASTMIPRMEEILGQVNYHGVDLHLYDDYWNWPIYMEELQNLINQTGKNPQEYFYVASEFGGPHPELEEDTQAFRAIRVNEYVHALDHLPLQWALFFKLVEDPGPEVAHPNSYLLNKELKESLSYEMLRRFVE